MKTLAILMLMSLAILIGCSAEEEPVDATSRPPVSPIDILTGEMIDCPTVEYKMEHFVPFNYSFNNEALNEPLDICENPVTGEIIIADGGNHCLYFFDKLGSFIRKAGSEGQGPGELMRPCSINCDDEGNIYVYEVLGQRMSIFSRIGEYISSFRLRTNFRQTFTITHNNDILLNEHDKKHYMSLYNKEGDLLHNFLPFPEKLLELSGGGSSIWTQGQPFIDNLGKYVIFLPSYLKILIGNSNGQQLQELSIPDVLKGHYIYDEITPFEKYEQGKGVPIPGLIQSVRYHSGYYYLKSIPDRRDRNHVNILVMDNDFEIIKRIRLHAPEEFEGIRYDEHISWFTSKFRILNDNKAILVPVSHKSQVLKFLPKDSN